MSRLWWIACLGLATPVSAATFVIHSGEKSKVEFESKAAMESFSGHTQSVAGTVQLNPAQLGDSLDAHVEVEMKTLDTGVGIRNRHMCENHLETEKYPKAVFEGGKLSQLSATSLAEG